MALYPSVCIGVSATDTHRYTRLEPLPNDTATGRTDTRCCIGASATKTDTHQIRADTQQIRAKPPIRRDTHQKYPSDRYMKKLDDTHRYVKIRMVSVKKTHRIGEKMTALPF